jgi:glutamate-1-semialdehyde aminotransferase
VRPPVCTQPIVWWVLFLKEFRASRSVQREWIRDADGRRYLDYHGAFDPLILGHSHPRVNAGVVEMLGRLDIVGAGVSDIEVEPAETLTRHVPSVERVLFLNSGTEATARRHRSNI